MWKFWRSRKDSKPSPPSPTPAPTPVTPEVRPTARPQPVPSWNSNAFAFKFWAQVRQTLPGNLALSPASISLALTMAWGGARGETADELRRVLHLEGSPDELLASVRGLLQAWNSDSGSTLRVANRFYGEQTYAFEQPYLELTRTTFGAPLEPVDFAKNSEAARVSINDWVARQTQDRIQDLIPPRGVDSGTRLALVNATYFKATWAKTFEEDSTRDGPFFLSANSRKDVSMMHDEDTYAFAALDGVKLLELPYEARDASMVFVLPDAVAGLDAVEQGLTRERFERWLAALRYETVNVALPRVEVTPSDPLTLAEPLKALGMERTFSSKADFTGIARAPSPEQELLLSEVFHKAFVRIDEQGTEAAAGTAAIMVEGSAMEEEPPKEFHADHPFLFFLRDTRSRTILFMGRVVDPTAE